jgi:hypothetical protein
VITGNPIDTPLRLVSTIANLTENDKITIVQVSILLEVTMGRSLAHSNQRCVRLMINNTTGTSAMATRTNPTRMTIVPEIVRILGVRIHILNIKSEINTMDLAGTNLVATTHRLLEISTVIKDTSEAMSLTWDSLVVTIERRGLLVVRQDPLHRIHPGRAVRKGNKTIIRIDHMEIHD